MKDRALTFIGQKGLYDLLLKLWKSLKKQEDASDVKSEVKKRIDEWVGFPMAFSPSLTPSALAASESGDCESVDHVGLADGQTVS
jgi:hypothetical protein